MNSINFIDFLEKEKEDLLYKLHLINQALHAYRDFSAVGINNTITELPMPFLNKSVELVFAAGKMTSIDIYKYHAYKKEEPIRKKILYILKNENRFLHVREIAGIAHYLERETSVVDFVKKISPALCTLKTLSNSNLVSYAVTNSQFNTFWGSKNWLDESGEIKQEHMYSSTQLSFNKKESYIF